MGRLSNGRHLVSVSSGERSARPIAPSNRTGLEACPHSRPANRPPFPCISDGPTDASRVARFSPCGPASTTRAGPLSFLATRGAGLGQDGWRAAVARPRRSPCRTPPDPAPQERPQVGDEPAALPARREDEEGRAAVHFPRTSGCWGSPGRRTASGSRTRGGSSLHEEVLKRDRISVADTTIDTEAFLVVAAGREERQDGRVRKGKYAINMILARSTGGEAVHPAPAPTPTGTAGGAERPVRQRRGPSELEHWESLSAPADWCSAWFGVEKVYGEPPLSFVGLCAIHRIQE